MAALKALTKMASNHHEEKCRWQFLLMVAMGLFGLYAEAKGQGQPIAEGKPPEFPKVQAAQMIQARAQTAFALQKKLEQWIHVEVAFVRRIVTLSPSQEATLAAIDLQKIESARLTNRKTAPGVIFNETSTPGLESRLAVSDPLYQHRFHRDVEKAIEAALDAQQIEKYRAERFKRDAFAREVAVDGLVLVLDQKLGLSPEQCTAIKQSLADWNDTTSINFNFYLSNSNYLPPVPENFVVPHLNASQRKVFETTPRIHVAESGSMPFVSGEIQIER